MSLERVRLSHRNGPHYGSMRAHRREVCTPDLLVRHGAVGWGIAPRIKGGQLTGEMAYCVYVERKWDDDRGPNKAHEPVRKSVRIPNLDAGGEVEVPFDVIQSRKPELQHATPRPPANGGMSCSATKSAVKKLSLHTGTLGGWVWDAQSHAVALISCEHVIGRDSGRAILQPGIGDAGRLIHKVGRVTRGRSPRNNSAYNIDCAIGAPLGMNVVDFHTPNIGPAVFATRGGELLDRVEKMGRTTLHTQGGIVDAHWNGLVTSIKNGKDYFFEDCLRILPAVEGTQWSAQGDSGSVVFHQDALPDGSGIKPAVGLHFAGADGVGIACRMENVFDNLNITTVSAGMLRRLIAVALSTRRISAQTRNPLDEGHLSPLGTAVESWLLEHQTGAGVARFTFRFRDVVCQALLTDPHKMAAAIAALRPFVGGSVAGIFARPVSDEERAGVVRVLEELATGIPEGGRAEATALIGAIRAMQNPTVAELFGVDLPT